MINVRYNISPCSRDEAKSFVDGINRSVYAETTSVMADDHSHYDRYGFVRDGYKVAVVYDNSASVLSITTKLEYADDLLKSFPLGSRSVKRSELPAAGGNGNGNRRHSASPDVKTVNGADGGKSRVFITPTTIDRRERAANVSTVIVTAKGAELATDEIYPPQRVTKLRKENGVIRPERPPQKNVVMPKKATISFGSDEDEPTPYPEKLPPQKRRGRPPKKVDLATADIVKTDAAQKGFVAVNFADKDMDALLAALSDGKNCDVSVDGIRAMNTPDELKVYKVADPAGNKIFLNYYSRAHRVELFGKQSALYAEVRNRLAKHDQRPIKTPTVTMPQQTPAPAPQQKQPVKPQDKQLQKAMADLKKYMPTACDYLTDLSKEYFAGALYAFGQRNLQLPDYSGLLVPPYRGLERLILDLQRSEGIQVKMVGQAYDKAENDTRVLKSGYVKSINKVVYTEVLVALYLEYEPRCMVTHTDNGEEDVVSRAIPDKEEARKQLFGLMKIIEYNAKKLKEIGYVIKKN